MLVSSSLDKFKVVIVFWLLSFLHWQHPFGNIHHIKQLITASMLEICPVCAPATGFYFRDYFHIQLFSRPSYCRLFWADLWLQNSKKNKSPSGGSTYEPKSSISSLQNIIYHIVKYEKQRLCCVRKTTIGQLLFQCQTVGEWGAETIELIVQSSGPLGRSQTDAEVFF